jgi:hypothetical protein
MRKTSPTPASKPLQLHRETIRELGCDKLLGVLGGCPWNISGPPTQNTQNTFPTPDGAR